MSDGSRSGVLVIDKPPGLTSHDVVAAARRLLGERRIGHTGTLDPMATGVLPLACGRATRLVRFLIASDKDYVAAIRFGLSTDTYDITGVEVGRSDRVPTKDEIEAALTPLRGEYEQMPPAYSAKKVDGERAYARARRDEPVSLKAVPVRVTRADLLDWSGRVARVVITCSAGFYVRSFARALGEAVGTGACLAELRRTRSGDFTLAQAVTIERLGATQEVAERWIGIDRLLPSLPAAALGEEGVRRITHGQEVLPVHGLTDRGPWPTPADTENDATRGWVRLTDPDGRLLALAKAGTTPNSLHPTVVLT